MVVTWGSPEAGGDNRHVQDELSTGGGVEHIYGNHVAFAALLSNGRVITWGDPIDGGDSSKVQAELSCARMRT